MIVYNYDADLEVSDTCVRSSLLSWVAVWWNCFRVFYLKNVYILALEMAKPRNNHCANCIGTLSFPMYRPVAFVHLLSLAFLAALTLLVDAREVRDDDGHRQRYDEHAAQWTDAADELAGDRRRHHVAVPAPAHTQCWLCVGWCRYGHGAGCTLLSDTVLFLAWLLTFGHSLYVWVDLYIGFVVCLCTRQPWTYRCVFRWHTKQPFKWAHVEVSFMVL